MCAGPYKISKMVKLQVWMELAPEYSRQGHLFLVFICLRYLIVVWLPAMFRNAGKLKGSHLSTKVM